MQYHAPDNEYIVYDHPVSVFLGSFVIDGASAGVTFEELTLHDFDNGLDKFIPPVPPPPYTPVDMSQNVLPQQTP